MERAWHFPDADTLGRALVIAEDAVAKTHVSHVVCAVVNDGEVGFNVLPVEGYATLRERGEHKHLTPIVSLTPNGRIEVYPRFQPLTLIERE